MLAHSYLQDLRFMLDEKKFFMSCFCCVVTPPTGNTGSTGSTCSTGFNGFTDETGFIGSIGSTGSSDPHQHHPLPVADYTRLSGPSPLSWQLEGGGG